MEKELTRGMVVRSSNEHRKGFYLIMNPGKNYSLVVDIFALSKDELSNGIMGGMGYEEEFIGRFHSKEFDDDFTFIPAFRPVPNEFLEGSDNDLVGILSSDDMRSFSQGMRACTGGYLYRRLNGQRPNGWWTLDRKREFINDCRNMRVDKIAQKWDVSVNAVYAMNTKFQNNLEGLNFLKKDSES